jgi:hypothetical protein
MPIDLSDLSKAAARASIETEAQRPLGIARWIANLHRGDVGAFVSVESTALPPIPVEMGDALAVAVWIATPAGPGLWRPWAQVIWSWPDGEVLVMERLGDDDAAASPLALALSSQEFGRLCDALQAWLERRGTSNPPTLDVYRQTLPPETLEALVGAFPSSRSLFDGDG